ncbi:hypothetical protein J1N35_027443 [Gossypium stocksii]|uniref:Uncharacterized protein n=1 Tax=Gossypium stocksii TaxID=47602 RepID=A0A9D3VAS9_9ROSI|nr:hypothetical protein J1N35_027443 [Gossypium stocksii]
MNIPLSYPTGGFSLIFLYYFRRLEGKGDFLPAAIVEANGRGNRRLGLGLKKFGGDEVAAGVETAVDGSGAGQVEVGSHRAEETREQERSKGKEEIPSPPSEEEDDLRHDHEQGQSQNKDTSSVIVALADDLKNQFIKQIKAQVEYYCNDENVHVVVLIPSSNASKLVALIRTSEISIGESRTDEDGISGEWN